MNANPVYGERVVVVEVHNSKVNLKTGVISSTASSHVHADNQEKTVVRGDRQFYTVPVACCSDEAAEKSFQVNDIHLLKQQEAHSLQDSATAQNWFGAIYQDPLVAKIQRALRRLKLP